MFKKPTITIVTSNPEAIKILKQLGYDLTLIGSKVLVRLPFTQAGLAVMGKLPKNSLDSITADDGTDRQDILIYTRP